MCLKIAEVEVSYRPKRSLHPIVVDSKDASELFRKYWDIGKINYRESLKIMLINANGRCLGISTISEGGCEEASVNMKHLFQAALIGNATRIILCHNHPSGRLRPSKFDDELTKDVKTGLKTIGIMLIDHIIITEDDYYSYVENGKL